MSRALALVRFDDGEIMHACYDGTSDILYPWLISDKDLEERFEGGTLF